MILIHQRWVFIHDPPAADPGFLLEWGRQWLKEKIISLTGKATISLASLRTRIQYGQCNCENQQIYVTSKAQHDTTTF